MIAAVREACVRRDGHCRLRGVVFGPCHPESEWAHLKGHRRFETRGKPPEERHTTRDSLMLCRTHHHAYDQHRIRIEPMTDRGADGPLRSCASPALALRTEMEFPINYIEPGGPRVPE